MAASMEVMGGLKTGIEMGLGVCEGHSWPKFKKRDMHSWCRPCYFVYSDDKIISTVNALMANVHNRQKMRGTTREE